MTKYYIFSLIVSLILLGNAGIISAQTVKELLEQGDRFAEEQFDNYKALENFQKAEKLEPNNYEVLWRLSRVYSDIAENMPSKTSEQKDAQLDKYQTSFNYADKAVKAAPDRSVTYVRRAVANGRIALFKGVFTAVGLVKSVKADAEKAIRLGNGGSYVQGLAHYVLGRTHFKVCDKAYLVRAPLGLGWGDMDVAEKELKKAVELYLDFRLFYLELGKYYIEEENYTEARKYLQKVKSSPKRNQNDDKNLSEANKLLSDIAGK